MIAKTKLTAREKAIGNSHRELNREATARFPRNYVDSELHRADCRIQAKEMARDFLRAMSRWEGNSLESTSIAAVLNSESPDDCQLVAREEFEEMRAHAIALWKFVEATAQAVDRMAKMNDPLGRISDELRNLRRFDREFRAAEMELPQIVENVI